MATHTHDAPLLNPRRVVKPSVCLWNSSVAPGVRLTIHRRFRGCNAFPRTWGERGQATFFFLGSRAFVQSANLCLLNEILILSRIAGFRFGLYCGGILKPAFRAVSSRFRALGDKPFGTMSFSCSVLSEGGEGARCGLGTRGIDGAGSSGAKDSCRLALVPPGARPWRLAALALANIGRKTLACICGARMAAPAADRSAAKTNKKARRDRAFKYSSVFYTQVRRLLTRSACERGQRGGKPCGKPCSCAARPW